MIDLHHFKPHCVFNVDEIEITTVQAEQIKVLGLKGKKQVGSITSAERSVLCTALICVPAGDYVPLYLNSSTAYEARIARRSSSWHWLYVSAFWLDAT